MALSVTNEGDHLVAKPIGNQDIYFVALSYNEQDILLWTKLAIKNRTKPNKNTHRNLIQKHFIDSVKELK